VFSSIITTNIQKIFESTNTEHTYIISKQQMIHNHIPTVHLTLAEPSCSESSSRWTANKRGLRTPPCITPLVTVKGDEKLVPNFTCIVFCLYQLNNSLTMPIVTLHLISSANSRLWFVLSNVLDQQCLTLPNLNVLLSQKLCHYLNTLRAAWFRRFSQKKTAVFSCLTNALAPPPIVLESSSAAQTDRPV